MKKYIALCGIIAALIGAQFVSARIYNTPSTSGFLTSLTPWTENVSGGGFSLSNVVTGAFTNLTATNATTTGNTALASTGGRVGIGTTGLPTGTFDVHGIANLWTSVVTAPNTAGQSLGLAIQAGTNNADSAFKVYNAAGSQSMFYIKGDGLTGIATTTADDMLSVQATGSNNIFEGYDASGNSKFLVRNDGSIGVATSTVTENQLTIQASSTKDILEGYDNTGLSKFLFKRTGGISTCESVLATSTSMTIDWTLCPTQIARLSTAAVTIAVSNNQVAGQNITLETCAPPTGTMGAITFTGVDWANQTVPTQTTTANNCDLWGFKPITATSSLIIHGAQTPNF